VELGANVNKVNNIGETPLFDACRNGYETIVKNLVTHLADINKENCNGKTPLFFSYGNGYEAIVKYLIKHGANINKENIYHEI